MKKFILMLLFLPLVASCATPSKSELDAEVKRLCAIDGGIKVYETVMLPSKRFDEYGNVKIPDKDYAKPGDEYYLESDIHYLREGNPEMWRSEHRIVRVRDKKIMGISIHYLRRGGDMPGPWHESSFGCPEIGSQPSLEKSIFVKGEEK